MSNTITKILFGVAAAIYTISTESKKHLASKEADNIQRHYARNDLFERMMDRNPEMSDYIFDIKLTADRWNSDKINNIRKDPITSWLSEMFK